MPSHDVEPHERPWWIRAILNRGVSAAVVVFVWLALIPAAFAEPAARPGESPPLETVVVQLPWFHQFQFAGLYAAIEKGYFRDAGLEVILQEGTQVDPIKGVLEGRANFGVGSSELLLNRLRGQPIVLLAAIFQRSPFCLLTTANTGITGPADLVGKRLMMRLNERDAEFIAMFRKAGVPLESMKLIESRWNLQDILDGRADAMAAYYTTQPYELRLLGGNPVTIRPSAYTADFYGDCLFTSEKEEDEHPARVAKFRAAALKGWSYAVENREEVFDWLLNKYAKNNPKITRAGLESEAQLTVDIILPEMVELGHSNPKRWQRLATTYRDLGMTTTADFGDRFIYQPSRSALDFWRTAGITVGLTALAMVAIAAFWNLRLQIKVGKQRQELMREIEERRRAEEALGVTREQLESFLANCPLAAFFKDESGRLVAVNRAFAEKHGHAPEWWAGKLPEEHLPPETASLFQRHDRQVREAGQPMQFQESIVDTNGRQQEWMTWRFPMKTPDGHSLLGGMSLDVTEQKKYEEALLLAEEKYRGIFENSVEGLMRIEADGRISTANAAAARFIGAESGAELAAKPVKIGERMVVSQEERDGYSKILKSGGTINGVEIQIVRNDGSRIWISASARAVFLPDGTLSHYEASMEDISERKRLADELRQSQKMDAIGRLAGGVAHDFNNLITAILGYSQLISAGLSAASPLREHLKQVISATERASELTRQLLTFSRRQTPERSPTCINKVVVEMENLLRRLIGEHIELKTRLDPELGLTLVDRSEFSQVVMNLVINARDAMPSGGVIEIETKNILIEGPSVRTGLNAKPGPYVCLSVTDNGCGMSTDTLSHIFEPFFTTKPRDQGTGLGLPTVYGIISHSDGHIDVDSEVGKGTTFRVHLPRAEAAEAAPETPRKNESPDGRERVMVVEDEAMLRTLVCELLRRQGYTVVDACNGEEAIQMLTAKKHGQIDLLVTDVVMPKMNGRELARRLQEIHPGTPVLYMSGYTDETILQGLEAQGFGFLQKPFTSSELASKVREIIDRRRTPG